MSTTSKVLNVRLPEQLLGRVERVRDWLSMQLPGATRTDAVRMVIQKGLEAMESDANGISSEDRAWLGSDLSRLGEIEPYNWGGVDPSQLGVPVRHLPNGAFVVKAGR